MKKSLVLAILGVTAGVTASYGQGQINFNNYYAEAQTTGVTYAYGGLYGGLGVGPEGSATLFWGASTDTSTSQLTAIYASTTPFGLGYATGPGVIGTGAGWFDGGNFTINGGVPGTYAFAIYVQSGFMAGWSPIVTGATQMGLMYPVPALPAALQQGSFTIDIIPEPSTMALSALGGLSLWLMRRKKA
jgi:hypothetical protein